jgi:putative hemolysin
LVTLARLDMLAGDRNAGAAAASYMKRNMEGSLAGIQLGITLVGAITAATGGAGAEEQLTPAFQAWLGVSPGMAEFLAIATVLVPLTFVTIIFGGLIPKVFALRNKEWVCLMLSPPMR